MKTLPLTALIAVLAGATVASAAPASADFAAGNTYNYVVTQSDWTNEGVTDTWLVTSCGTDCAHVHIPAGGRYKVVRDYDFHRTGNRWTASLPMGPVELVITVDNDSLAGEEKDEYSDTLFQLTKTG